MCVCVCVFSAAIDFVNRPKDVQGCSAAPEEFSFTAVLALFLFLRFSLCVCVCVCDFPPKSPRSAHLGHKGVRSCPLCFLTLAVLAQEMGGSLVQISAGFGSATPAVNGAHPSCFSHLG